MSLWVAGTLVLLFPPFAKVVLDAMDRSSSKVFSLKQQNIVTGANSKSLAKAQQNFKKMLNSTLKFSEVASIVSSHSALETNERCLSEVQVSIKREDSRKSKQAIVERLQSLVKQERLLGFPPLGKCEGMEGIVLRNAEFQKVLDSDDGLHLARLSCEPVPMELLRYRTWLVNMGPSDPGRVPIELSSRDKRDILELCNLALRLEAVFIDRDGDPIFRLESNQSKSGKTVVVPAIRGPISLTQEGDFTEGALPILVASCVAGFSDDHLIGDYCDGFSSERSSLNEFIEIVKITYDSRENSICVFAIIRIPDSSRQPNQDKKKLYFAKEDCLQHRGTSAAKILFAAARTKKGLRDGDKNANSDE